MVATHPWITGLFGDGVTAVSQRGSHAFDLGNDLFKLDSQAAISTSSQLRKAVYHRRQAGVNIR